MNERIKQLMEELVKSGKDFTLDNEQTEIRIWLGGDSDYSLVFNSLGKWTLE